MGSYKKCWGYYPSYTPSQPKKVEDGIKLKSQRGAIGDTWWSNRWISVLESFGMGARLTRGKSYARQGQVVSIEIDTGNVTARVQGSKPSPYRVSITMKPISKSDWVPIFDAMAGRAMFAAKLLCGEMPQAIEDVFIDTKVPLFPSRAKDLETDCSCPDDANPCKHIAAVYYILAEMFDEDPFLIFRLRGMSKEVLMDSLRQKRAAIEPAGRGRESEGWQPSCAPSREPGASEVASQTGAIPLDRFWDLKCPLPRVETSLSAPEIPGALLKRAGASPFSLGNQNLTDILAHLYNRIASFTKARLAGSEADGVHTATGSMPVKTGPKRLPSPDRINSDIAPPLARGKK